MSTDKKLTAQVYTLSDTGAYFEAVTFRNITAVYYKATGVMIITDEKQEHFLPYRNFAYIVSQEQKV